MLGKDDITMLTLSSRAKQHSPETHRALQSAEGYVFLGLHREALKELDTIEAADQFNSDVMIARIRILLHLGRFARAAKLSAHGEALHTEEDEFTVQRAFALHQLDKRDEAAKVIQSAPAWLRRTGILHYNLGCYQARWGDIISARQCVNAAIQLNAAIELSMKKDPDLEGLWN
jgi:tetratricopeptide (TPR) repeat protein